MKLSSIAIAAIFLLSSVARPAEVGLATTKANVPVEISFTAERNYGDPFRDVTLDVVFTQPAGAVLRVPAFWAGGNKWKVRYSSQQIGVHRWKSECRQAGDAGLDGATGVIEVAPYKGDN